MSNQYYLSINASKKELSEWDITSATLNINNQSSDELIFTTSQEIDINATVELYRDSSRIFSGTIYKAPEVESANSDATKSYQALGPWYELEEIVYQQHWSCVYQNPDGSTYIHNALKSHIILGQSSDGNQIDAGVQITNILNYATGASANIDIGIIGLSSPMLYDETKDISCAQAIKRILKWAPDAIVYFDYSQTTPIINILKKDAQSIENIDINIDKVKSYAITPREDLRISGVEIKYEKTHSVDGESWNTMEFDVYPLGFDSQSKKALIMTVELEGYKATQEYRQIVCEELQTDSIEWWQERVPFLRDAANIVIKEVNREHPTYRYELISGSVPEWAITNADAQPDEIEAIFSYETDNCTYTKKVVTHKFIATNSASNTFSRSLVSEYEEPAPSNLAESLYDSLSSLMYDAKIVLFDAQADDFVAKKINLLNSKSDYSSMQSPVMNLSQDLFSDTLVIKAGPPKQLYPANIAEIFRINRNRASTTNFSSKITGKSASNYSLSIKDTYPQENTTSCDQIIQSLSLGTSEEPKKIEIDSIEIPYGLSMKIAKVLVAKNGEEAYSYALMTDAKTQAELDELEAEYLASMESEEY